MSFYLYISYADFAYFLLVSLLCLVDDTLTEFSREALIENTLFARVADITQTREQFWKHVLAT